MRAGDVILVHFEGGVGSEQKGERPAVIIKKLENGLLVSPMTDLYKANGVMKKVNPSEMVIPAGNGITKDSKLMLYHFYPINSRHIKQKLGRLTESQWEMAKEKIKFSLGLIKPKAEAKKEAN